MHIFVSIGITFFPDDAVIIKDFLKNSDQAMYAAKKMVRNRYNYFIPSMQEAAIARMRLVNDMRNALVDTQFRLYYQPIVDLVTGVVHKAEALIRWEHPVRGMVSPEEFICAAEETGMIVEIDDWVFREAVRQPVGVLYSTWIFKSASTCRRCSSGAALRSRKPGSSIWTNWAFPGRA